MNRHQLISRISEDRENRYTQSSIWQPALQHGLSWRDACIDRFSIREAAKLLSSNAAIVLQTMLRRFAAKPVEREKLLTETRCHTTLSGAECLLGLAELESAGILFSVRKVWGERVYFLPIDHFVVWHQAIFPHSIASIASEEKEKLIGGKVRAYRRPLGRQLLTAFALLGKCGVELTSKGVLSKKTITKLVQSIELEEQWFVPFGLKWSLREHYPLKAAFILEAGSALGLLQKSEGRLFWDEKQLYRWLRLDEKGREAELLDWCFSLLLPSHMNGAHAAAVLKGLDSEQWFSADQVREGLLIYRLGQSGSEHEGFQMEKTVELWCGLLHSFGWMDVVDVEGDGSNNLYFRWKSSPQQSENVQEEALHNSFLTVQPNKEIIVQPNCPFVIRWELELIAARVADEQITVYRLDAAAVAQALENGRTRHSILDFLVRSSGGEPLPSTIYDLLEVWTSRACRIDFVETLLLRCDNEEMAAFIEKNAETAQLLGEKLNSTVFIIDKLNVDRLRQLLEQAGYPPRKGIQSHETSVHKQYPMYAFAEDELTPSHSTIEHSRPLESFFYETFSMQHFELAELTDHEHSQSFAQLENIPAMWTKQLRAYHHSTRKELIEQALEWQTPVQLRMKQGLCSFVPEKLEQRDGCWSVVGLLRDMPERELIRLTPDMWEEMRLVIPGQLDTI